MSAFQPCAGPLEEDERPKTGTWRRLPERAGGGRARRGDGAVPGLNDRLPLTRTRYPQADNGVEEEP